MANFNSKEVQEVFRQNHITATGLDALRQGYEAKGDYFMYQFMKAYSPKTSILNSFSSGEDQLDSQNSVKPKRTFEDWLTLIGKAGQTIADVKNDILGTPSSETSVPDPAPKKKSSVLIYVIAGVVLLVIGYLIYKQSKS